MDLSQVNWTAVSSQFTAVVVAAVTLYKAIKALVGIFKKK